MAITLAAQSRRLHDIMSIDYSLMLIDCPSDMTVATQPTEAIWPMIVDSVSEYARLSYDLNDTSSHFSKLSVRLFETRANDELCMSRDSIQSFDWKDQSYLKVQAWLRV